MVSGIACARECTFRWRRVLVGHPGPQPERAACSAYQLRRLDQTQVPTVPPTSIRPCTGCHRATPSTATRRGRGFDPLSCRTRLEPVLSAQTPHTSQEVDPTAWPVAFR